LGIRLRANRFFICLSLVGGAVAFAATPAGAGPSPATSPIARHYYSDGTVGVAAVGGKQCTRPMSQRIGAWFCGMVSQSRGAAPAFDPISGHCSVNTCWYEYNASRVEIDVTGAYGYGRTILGDITSLMTDTFNGGQSTTSPFWMSSTRDVADWACSGERIYFSTAHPNGASIDNGISFQSDNGGAMPAYATIRCFGGNGYTYYEGTDAWAGVAHQFQWHDPSYPGTWWFAVMSPKFQHQSSGAYFTLTPMEFGPEPFFASWDPE
jgi:hypothetical protein